MIVVSIIGILASVSSVYFKTYQSKSKMIQAKIELTAAYTAEIIFYNAYDIYATCLSDAGFESPVATKKNYALGFSNTTANINALVHSDAIKAGLSPGICPPNLAPTQGVTYFLAGTGAGSAVMGTVGEFRAAVTNYSNNIDDGGAPTVSDVEEGIGDMSTIDKKAFVIPAAGYINSDYITPATSSLLTIDQNKKIRVIRSGF